MPKPTTDPPPGFDHMTFDKRIEYVGALWDRIAADPDRVPIPDWHVDIVEGERSALEVDGDPGPEWAQGRDELRKEIRESTN